MKNFYIALALLIISCVQGAKNEKGPKIETLSAVETIETPAGFTQKSEAVDFVKLIATTKSKKLPLIETTDFKSFIDEDDYDEIDAKALKLDQIYLNLNSKGNNFRALRCTPFQHPTTFILS